eukprot:2971346-Rhodomonas_salina.1
MSLLLSELPESAGARASRHVGAEGRWQAELLEGMKWDKGCWSLSLCRWYYFSFLFEVTPFSPALLSDYASGVPPPPTLARTLPLSSESFTPFQWQRVRTVPPSTKIRMLPRFSSQPTNGCTMLVTRLSIDASTKRMFCNR